MTDDVDEVEVQEESFNPDAIFAEACDKNANGTLTLKEAPWFGYFRLLEGKHAGRVVIKSCAKIDGKSICFFANGLIWIYMDKIKDVRCELAYPQFNAPMHPVDRSQATWYNDNSDQPQGHDW